MLTFWSGKSQFTKHYNTTTVLFTKHIYLEWHRSYFYKQTNFFFQGLVTGLGKGMVGTITKPVTGMLDFATEAASAVRVTSKNTAHICPMQARSARCCTGLRGLLPLYSEKFASGQKLLHKLTENNDEK